MKNEIKILPASPEDILSLAHIRKETWLATYPNKEFDITVEDLLSEDFDSKERIEGWTGLLEKPNISNLIAKDGETVVGFIIAVKGSSDNQIRGLYVLPQYQGQGIGKALMEEVLPWLGTEKDISLKVAVYNDRAIRFYEKLGFVKGDKVIATSDDLLSSGKEIPEIFMTKEKS